MVPSNNAEHCFVPTRKTVKAFKKNSSAKHIIQMAPRKMLIPLVNYKDFTQDPKQKSNETEPGMP